MSLTTQIMAALRAAEGQAGYTVGLDVPSERPARLITVIRTGGGGGRFHETAAYTVDITAPTQLEADKAGATVRSALLGLESLTGIGRVAISGEAQMPKPVGGRIIPCYRINLQITHAV